MKRIVASTVAVAALTAALAGCTKSSSTGVAAPSGGGSSATDASGSGSPSGAASGTASSGAPSDSPSPSASATSTVPPFHDDSGKTISAPDQPGGTTVTANGTKAQVLVKPVSIVAGAAADLGNTPKGDSPVYVTVSFTNAGTTTLEYPSLATDLIGTDSTGSPAQQFASTKTPKACPTKLPPASFKPGSVFTQCTLFVISKGSRLATLAYRPAARSAQVTWTIPKDYSTPK